MKFTLPLLGAIIIVIGGVLYKQANPLLQIVGECMAGIGTILAGASAKQFNQTGGTKPVTPEAESRVAQDKK